jgi:hypothetical protein
MLFSIRWPYMRQSLTLLSLLAMAIAGSAGARMGC